MYLTHGEITDQVGIILDNEIAPGLTPAAEKAGAAFFADERRLKPRIYYPFPIKISGVDAEGAPFECDTVIDNLCAGGLYLRTVARVEPGAELTVMFRFALAPVVSAPLGGAVKAKGKVLRINDLWGVYGLAVALNECSFH